MRAAGKRLVDAYQEALLSLDELRQRMPQLRSKEIAVRTQLEAIDARLAAQASYLKLAETLESFLGQLRQATTSASALHPPEVLRLVVREVLVGLTECSSATRGLYLGPILRPVIFCVGSVIGPPWGTPSSAVTTTHPITPVVSHLFTASTGRHRSLAAWTRTCSGAWRASDRRVLRLIRLWLKAGVMEDGSRWGLCTYGGLLRSSRCGWSSALASDFAVPR